MMGLRSGAQEIDWRRVRPLGNRNIGGASSGAAAAIVDLGIDGVRAHRQARGVPARIGAGAVYRAAGRRVAVGERVIIRIAGVHMDRHGIR